MRVGLVGPVPPPSGGMANQTRQLARLLEREGVDVELVPVNPPYRPAWIEKLRGMRAGFRLVPYAKRLWTAAGRCDVFHVMANSGWSWHLFAVPAIRIGQMRKIPVVVNYRGGEAEVFLRRSKKRVVPTMRRASSIIVPSGFLQDVFRQFDVETRVVPNVVDLERFGRARSEVDSSTSASKSPHVIVTRNLEAIYDIPTALRAFVVIRSHWPDARLSIAGSGPLRDELESLARYLNIDDVCTFTGRLDVDAMADLYRSADLMLNPTTVDNTPNSVLEALASGVPVVSTNVGGVPYLVEDGVTGLLVPRADPSALGNAAVSLLVDEVRRTSMMEAGRREVKRYTWERVRPVLLSTYEEAIGGHSVRR